MWTVLTVSLVILAVYIASRVSARQNKRIREAEERGRREFRKELSELEIKYLKQGTGDSWSNEFPDIALRSLGNVAYLIWLLNYEPKFRSHRGDAKNPYPPDWEWRRRFVFLRDRGVCQGCKKDSAQGIILDCHHIKPIAEFGATETGVHSINNLVALCQFCHAGQHPSNRMLAERASRSSLGEHHWSLNSCRRSNQKRTPNIPMREFPRPEVIEVHPFADALSAQTVSVGAKALLNPVDESERVGWLTEQHRDQALRPKAEPSSKSVTEGLAWIDEQISGLKLQDADQFLEEEDKYGHCDYCDKEIPLNSFNVSSRGTHLCDDCYSSTGGKE